MNISNFINIVIILIILIVLLIILYSSFKKGKTVNKPELYKKLMNDFNIIFPVPRGI